jgi:hypothetical protein
MRIKSNDGRYSIEITGISDENRVAFDAYFCDEAQPFLSGESVRYLNKVEALNAIGLMAIGIRENGILPDLSKCGLTAPVESFKDYYARKRAERS